MESIIIVSSFILCIIINTIILLEYNSSELRFKIMLTSLILSLTLILIPITIPLIIVTLVFEIWKD